MFEYNLKNNKKLRVFEFHDIILRYDDDEKHQTYFYKYSDEDLLVCVVARNYADVFHNLTIAEKKVEKLNSIFGLKFKIERLW